MHDVNLHRFVHCNVLHVGFFVSICCCEFSGENTVNLQTCTDRHTQNCLLSLSFILTNNVVCQRKINYDFISKNLAKVTV